MVQPANVVPFTRSKPARGAQCPRCFTFNLFEYFRAKVAESRGEAPAGSTEQLKCALCGYAYSTAPAPARAA